MPQAPGSKQQRKVALRVRTRLREERALRRARVQFCGFRTKLVLLGGAWSRNACIVNVGCLQPTDRAGIFQDAPQL